jgi:Ca2+-binding EF-hand superfamily protein
MFIALDLDQNDFLDWFECRDMVAAVMEQDGGYNAETFKSKYFSMDKNDDGKIAKSEFIEAVV